MASAPLSPGEKVVVPALVARSAATASGAATAGVLAWMHGHTVLISLLGLLAGGFLGFSFGGRLGKNKFRGAEGNLLVVKAGRGSLSLALKAACWGGILTAWLTGVIGYGIWHMEDTWVAVVLGMIVGLLLAFPAALL